MKNFYVFNFIVDYSWLQPPSGFSDLNVGNQPFFVPNVRIILDANQSLRMNGIGYLSI